MHLLSIQSVQFSCSAMSDFLRPHGWHHTRLLCPSPISWACSKSCPVSRWCHSTILSSVIPFSSCLQSFPASGSFPMSQLFPSGAEVLELHHQPFQWIFSIDFLYDWLVWFPCCPRDSQESSPASWFESIHFSAFSLFRSLTLTCFLSEWVEVVQSCPTLCNPMDCSLPVSSVHEILQARILEWVAVSFSIHAS